MSTKEQIIAEHVSAYVIEWGRDEPVDLEWTGTGFGELSTQEQQLFDGWKEFHDAIQEGVNSTC